MEQAGLSADLHAFNGVLHSLVGAQRMQRADPSMQQAMSHGVTALITDLTASCDRMEL